MLGIVDPLRIGLTSMGDAVSGSEDRDWTVIGIWLDDRPVVAGVIAGRHEVEGGDDCSDWDFRGPWATSVSASSVEEAEKSAVQEMLCWDRQQYFEA